jgi:hypothetical protein
MDTIDFTTVINQLPNFLGLLIAIYAQWRIIAVLEIRLDKLIDVIVTKENCEDSAP